jgi:hypothetical protein
MVGVQQAGRRPALHGGGEFPAEVGRVLDAGVHALPAGRGMDMGGVTGQQHPAVPVAGHLPFLAVEPGHPPRVVHAEISAEDPAGHIAHLVQVDRGFFGPLVTPLPGDDPVKAVAERHDEGEGVAAAFHGQHVRGRLGEPHLGQHHRPHHGLSGKRHPQGLADRAVHPVGAHDPACAHDPVRAAILADLHLDCAGVLGELGDLAAVTDVRTHPSRPFFQHRSVSYCGVTSR